MPTALIVEDEPEANKLLAMLRPASRLPDRIGLRGAGGPREGPRPRSRTSSSST